MNISLKNRRKNRRKIGGFNDQIGLKTAETGNRSEPTAI